MELETFDVMAETSQLADYLARADLLRLVADGRPPLLVPHGLVQDLPDQSAKSVADGANRLGIVRFAVGLIQRPILNRKVTSGMWVRIAPAAATRIVVFSNRERTSRGLLYLTKQFSPAAPSALTPRQVS